MFRKLIFVVAILTANVLLMSADSSDANGQIFRRRFGVNSSSAYNIANQRYAQPQAAEYRAPADRRPQYSSGARPQSYAAQYNPRTRNAQSQYATQQNQPQRQAKSTCSCQKSQTQFREQMQSASTDQQFSQQAAYNAPANQYQQIQRTTYLDPRTNRQVDLARQPQRFTQPQPATQPQAVTVNGNLSAAQPIANASPIANQPAIRPATIMPQATVTTTQPAIDLQLGESPSTATNSSAGLSLTSPVGTTTVNSSVPQQDVAAPQESFSVLEFAE